MNNMKNRVLERLIWYNKANSRQDEHIEEVADFLSKVINLKKLSLYNKGGK